MNIFKIIKNNTKIRYTFVGGIFALLAIGGVFVNAKESSAQGLLQQANELFLSHDFQAAEDMYLQVLDTNATTQWAHHQLGRVYFSRSELKKALGEFNQEIALHKDSINSFYMRGLTHVFLEDLELGEKDFRTFLDAKPNSEAGNNDFAQILFVQGKFQQAEQVLMHILSFYPESFLAKQGLGAVYLELGEFTKAKQYVQDTLDTVLAMDTLTFMKYYPSLNPKNAEDGIATIREGIRYNLTLVDFGQQGLFNKQQVASKSFAPYFQSASGKQRRGAVFLAASCEANYEHFSNECFDTISPTISINATPSSPNDQDGVAFSTLASDSSGIAETRIFIDENNDGNYNDNGKTCASSFCAITTGPYEGGQIVKYYATTRDVAGNFASTLPAKSFVVISSPPTNVSIFASPVGNVVNGTTVTYTAVADKDVGNTPYWIDIFKDGFWKKGCKSGATCSYDWSDSNITSTFTAKIERLDFSDIIATDSITTTWGKIATQLPSSDFSLEPTSIISGAIITIRGWLRDNSGNGIGGKPVQLQCWNGSSWPQVVSGTTEPSATSTGYTSFFWTPNSSWQGDVSCRLHFAGDSLYIASTSGSSVINIAPIPACSVPGSPVCSYSAVSNTLNLQWNSVTGATGYKMEWARLDKSYGDTTDTTGGTNKIVSGTSGNTNGLKTKTWYKLHTRVESGNACVSPSLWSPDIECYTGSCEKQLNAPIDEFIVGECTVSIQGRGWVSDGVVGGYETFSSGSNFRELYMDQNSDSCDNDLRIKNTWDISGNSVMITTDSQRLRTSQIFDAGFELSVVSNGTGVCFISHPLLPGSPTTTGDWRMTVNNDTLSTTFEIVHSIPPTSKITLIRDSNWKVPQHVEDTPGVGEHKFFLSGRNDGAFLKTYFLHVLDQDADNDLDSCGIEIVDTNEAQEVVWTTNRSRTCGAAVSFTVGGDLTGADCQEEGSNTCEVRVWSKDQSANISNDTNLNIFTRVQPEYPLHDFNVIKFGVDYSEPSAQ